MKSRTKYSKASKELYNLFKGYSGHDNGICFIIKLHVLDKIFLNKRDSFNEMSLQYDDFGEGVITEMSIRIIARLERI